MVLLQHDIEIEVVDKLSSLLKLFKSHPENDENKGLNRTNELFMVSFFQFSTFSVSYKFKTKRNCGFITYRGTCNAVKWFQISLKKPKLR